MAQEKKVILFVVEGPSDETAMALIFEKLYVNERVFFDVVHTDLTTLALHDRSKSNKGVLELLREDVLEHIRKEPYQWTDLEKVIVIVDTDGAFIASENVIEIPGVEISYSLDHIEASNADSICRRNEHKSRELRVLSSKPFLTYKRHQVELRTYYLSRNMEHVFHDEVGSLSDREKERLARQFQQQYANDIEGLKHSYHILILRSRETIKKHGSILHVKTIRSREARICILRFQNDAHCIAHLTF